MTTALPKGANCPLTADVLRVDAGTTAAGDVSALLLGPGAKVRSDDDFIFYNQPLGPGVRFVHTGSGRPDAIEITLSALPPGIDSVVLTLSLDGTAAPDFGHVSRFTGTVYDAASLVPVATFTPDGLTRETALVLFEVYRRAGVWKLRAVGQGYANGLGGIATDFGVNVTDDQPQAAPVPPPPPMPPPPAFPPPMPAMPPAPAVPPPPPVAPPVTPTVQPPARVNLDKGRVVLTKHQTVSLVKTGAPPLTRVRMGLGWEPAKQGRDIDLDASCLVFDAHGGKLATVWFMKLNALNGAIVHAGDNLTGEGEGDDEQITVHLDRLPAEAHALVFTVNSFSGQKFTEIRRAHCRLVDDTSGTELVRFELTDGEPHTALLMCKIVRDAGAWAMTALGTFADGRTVNKLEGVASAAVRA